MRWALRLGLACLAALLLGLGWGVVYLTRHFGLLGWGLSAGAMLIVLPLAALSLPTIVWLRGQLRGALSPPPVSPKSSPELPKGESGQAHKWLVGAIAFGAPGLVAWPATWTEGDSFPLSSYPMFAQPRPTATFVRLVGEQVDGGVRRVPVQALFPGEPLQARVLLNLLVQHPKSGQWCQRLRKRRTRGAKPLRGLRVVRLEKQALSPLAYFQQGPQAGRAQALGSCHFAPDPPAAEGP